MVQKPLLKDLLVQARAVKADVLAHLDVGDQGLVGGRGHDAVGIVALVQHEPLEDVSPLILTSGRQWRCSAGPRSWRPVHDAAVGIAQFKSMSYRCGSDGDQSRRRSSGNGRSGGATSLGARRPAPSPRRPRASFRVACSVRPGRFCVSGCSRWNRAVRHVRRHARAAQARLRHRLHPDRLPDAGRARVKAAMRGVLLGLLAARLRPAPVVPRPDDDR